MKIRTQIILAALSGILVGISFPTLIFGFRLPEMGFIAWFALAPLFVAIRSAPPKRAYLLTFVSSLVWYGISMFWVYYALHDFGNIASFTSIVLVILLVVFMASYISIAPMAARYLDTRLKGGLAAWLPAAWVAVEICRNYFPFGGFPWANLTMSQWRFLPIIQIADITGIYGIIFLIVAVNVLITEIIETFFKDKRFFPIREAIVIFILFIFTLGYGFYRLYSIPLSLAGAPSLSLGIIQGNIPQDEKTLKERAMKNLDTYREGTRKIAESSVEMIIWPESSFPWIIKDDDTYLDPQVLGLPKEGLGEMPYTLFGALTKTADGLYQNSAITVNAEGYIKSRYHKTHLVPFGEYVPYRKMFFFARKLVETLGEFLPGDSSMPMNARPARPGVLICYEDIFPEISRQSALKGADVLVNLTNDAWFDKSSALYQHLALSIFRAVENRRFLARATNTGVSAIVMPTGKIMIESGIYEPALIVSPVALWAKLTPYTLYGDWFAWGLAVYVLLGFIVVLYKKRRMVL